MDELVNQVMQRTGLSEEHSRTAVETVINFLKKRLPEPLASQIDSALSGSDGADGGGGFGDMAKKVGGMFGQK